MRDTQLEKLFDASSRLFILRGFARTQIGDIVKETGISTGAIYNRFTGKQAILRFVLKCVVDPKYLEEEHDFPIPEDAFAHLDDEIMDAFRGSTDGFRAHLGDGTDAYPFPRMLSDAFDVICRYRVGCLFFEKNPRDCGALGGYYVDYRRSFFESVLRYVEQYMEAGQVRALDRPAYSVQLMIETMAWWGMHVHYDAFQPLELSDEDAKAVCMDALLHGFSASRKTQ